MDRREFLKKSMLLTAGALIGGSLFSETSAAKGAKQNGIPRKKKSIGLQLYSIGGDMSADAAQALRQISEMGYSTAETASYGDGKFYGRTPAEFRKMAEDLGIAVTGAHIARELDKNDMQGCMDWWKQACDAQAAVGGKTIVMPYFPVGSTLADLQDYCDYFNRVGEIANAAGLRFGYHNHSHEFNKIEGQVIEDYMIENTDPDKVRNTPAASRCCTSRTWISSEPARRSISSRSSRRPTSRDSKSTTSRSRPTRFRPCSAPAKAPNTSTYRSSSSRNLTKTSHHV